MNTKLGVAVATALTTTGSLFLTAVARMTLFVVGSKSSLASPTPFDVHGET